MDRGTRFPHWGVLGGAYVSPTFGQKAQIQDDREPMFIHERLGPGGGRPPGQARAAELMTFPAGPRTATGSVQGQLTALPSFATTSFPQHLTTQHALLQRTFGCTQRTLPERHRGPEKHSRPCCAECRESDAGRQRERRPGENPQGAEAWGGVQAKGQQPFTGMQRWAKCLPFSPGCAPLSRGGAGAPAQPGHQEARSQ